MPITFPCWPSCKVGSLIFFRYTLGSWLCRVFGKKGSEEMVPTGLATSEVSNTSHPYDCKIFFLTIIFPSSLLWTLPEQDGDFQTYKFTNKRPQTKPVKKIKRESGAMDSTHTVVEKNNPLQSFKKKNTPLPTKNLKQKRKYSRKVRRAPYQPFLIMWPCQNASIALDGE